MKLSKALRAFLDKAQVHDSYWVEKAKLQFAMGLEQQRATAEMTYAAIAKKIGTSAAYISKVFRGDSNVTIETMVKLARATGGRLDIQIVDCAIQAQPQNVFRLQTHTGPRQTLVLPQTVTESASRAANHDAFIRYDSNQIAA